MKIRSKEAIEMPAPTATRTPKHRRDQCMNQTTVNGHNALRRRWPQASAQAGPCRRFASSLDPSLQCPARNTKPLRVVLLLAIACFVCGSKAVQIPIKAAEAKSIEINWKLKRAYNELAVGLRPDPVQFD